MQRLIARGRHQRRPFTCLDNNFPTTSAAGRSARSLIHNEFPRRGLAQGQPSLSSSLLCSNEATKPSLFAAFYRAVGRMDVAICQQLEGTNERGRWARSSMSSPLRHTSVARWPRVPPSHPIPIPRRAAASWACLGTTWIALLPSNFTPRTAVPFRGGRGH